MKSNLIFFETVVAAMLVAFPSMALAQGNLVIHGDFEPDATGWELVNGATFALSIPSGHAVFLNNEQPSPSVQPTTSQTINSLSPGMTYSVSGSYMMGKDRGGASASTPSFGVALDGVYFFEAASQTNAATQWQNFSLYYTATSGSARLSLSSQINGTGVEYAIDDIFMYAVPEPSALALIVLASGILFCGCRVFR